MTTLNDHAQESESRFSCLSAADPENIPDVRKEKTKNDQVTTKAQKSNKPRPPALSGGRPRSVRVTEATLNGRGHSLQGTD